MRARLALLVVLAGLIAGAGAASAAAEPSLTLTPKCDFTSDAPYQFTIALDGFPPHQSFTGTLHSAGGTGAGPATFATDDQGHWDFGWGGAFPDDYTVDVTSDLDHDGTIGPGESFHAEIHHPCDDGSALPGGAVDIVGADYRDWSVGDDESRWPAVHLDLHASSALDQSGATGTAVERRDRGTRRGHVACVAVRGAATVGVVWDDAEPGAPAASLFYINHGFSQLDGDGFHEYTMVVRETAADRPLLCGLDPMHTGSSAGFSTTGTLALRSADPSLPDTPPTLTVPGAVTRNATRPAGARVAYRARAVDAQSTATLACTRPPGSLLPPGATRVGCTARDAGGHTARRSFVVHVRGPRAQLTSLAARLAPRPFARRLAVHARGALARHHHRTACRTLHRLAHRPLPGRVRARVARTSGAAGC